MSVIRNVATFKNWIAFYSARFGLLNREVTLRLRDHTKIIVRPNTEDLTIVKSVFVTRHYVRDFIPITQGSTVVDVGAHIGAFSMLAAHRARKVLAFEPEPSNYQLLQRNITLNKLFNVFTFNMAVGGSRGERPFYIRDPASSGGHSLFGTAEAGTKVTRVRTQSLADIMTEQNLSQIDFLKLDCEGAEHEIIDSLTRDLASRVRHIVLECHKIGERSPSHIAEVLQRLGFQTVLEDDGGYIYAKHL